MTNPQSAFRNPHSRRALLQTTACGFGSLALNALASQSSPVSHLPSPIFPHHPPRAKRVIFLFMAGGVSHIDSFDYKPKLFQNDGVAFTFDDARTVAKTGKGASMRVMKPLWEFKQRGQSGLWASDLFPHMASMADDLCLVKGMHTEGVAHGPATLFLHTGTTNFIRPSMGAWINYGLGTENENLPGFVSISPSLSNGGPRNYGTAFLPSRYQGTPLGRAGQPAKEAAIKNLQNPSLSASAKARQFDLLRDLHSEQLQRVQVTTQHQEVEAVIQSYELAWRLQSNAPHTLDIDTESPATKKLYGIDETLTDNFGRQCLMARRLAESGVRFIQVNYTDNSNNPAWDQHSNMPKHKDHALAVDKPIAGLLQDLKQRGLLEDTLVWWGGEFGRTPYAQGNGTGRDHNPGGFCQWLAGAGVKPGFSFGETDDFGHHAIADKVHMHDMHATILHLLGLDHEKLTYPHAGRNFRLTDVHGHVVKDLLA
jgi:hypothetical protein